MIYKSGLNYYALYLDCYGGTGSSTIRYIMDMRSLLQGFEEKDRLKIMKTKVNKNFFLQFMENKTFHRGF